MCVRQCVFYVYVKHTLIHTDTQTDRQQTIFNLPMYLIFQQECDAKKMGVEGPEEKEKGEKSFVRSGFLFFLSFFGCFRQRKILKKKKVQLHQIDFGDKEAQDGNEWDGGRSWGWNGEDGGAAGGRQWYDGRMGKVEKWWEKTRRRAGREKKKRQSAHSSFIWLLNRGNYTPSRWRSRWAGRWRTERLCEKMKHLPAPRWEIRKI